MNALCLFIAAQTNTLTIDPRATQGTWEGWGTSLCWMGKTFGDRDDIADLLFTTKTVRIGDEDLPGLGLNIVRYNAGACSWNAVDGRTMVVSKTIQAFRQMEGFWLDPNKPDPNSDGWNWTLDAKQREMVLKAKARGANRVELFSNSPMWWMCANDNPSGAAKATVDNLRPDQVHAFATYLAEVALSAKRRWGFSFTSIEPFNEPLSAWWDANCKQEGCHFSVEMQQTILPLLHEELSRRGLQSLPISASDETYVSDAIEAWNGYSDSDRQLVSQVNVHGYQGPNAPREKLRETLGEHRLWISEHGEGDGSGLDFARDLGLDLHDLKPRAWCYWQPLDGGGWGFLNSDVPHAKVIHSNPKYFVMAQFSRHIRAGMTILQTPDANSVAAYDRKRHKLILVLLNSGQSESSLQIDLSRFSRPGKLAQVWLTSPRGTTRYTRQADLNLAGSDLNVTMPASSVETIELPASV